MSSVPQVSVVITTRNRRAEVLRAVASAWAQTVDLEVLVCDDASPDGTVEAVVAAFPDTRILSSDERLGSVVQRNRAVREARAPHFVTLDDDAEFTSPHTLEHVLGECDHERIGAIALPVLDVGREERSRFRAPDGPGRWVTDSYAGCAALLARAPFLALGGFREQLFHGGEEPEYSRRLLHYGLVVRLSSGPVVLHRRSAERRLDEGIRLDSRSVVLQAVWSLPLREFPIRLALPLAHGLRHGHPLAALQGLYAGAGDAYRSRDLRDPLDVPLARLSRRMEVERLRRRFTLRVEDVESYLPPLPGDR